MRKRRSHPSSRLSLCAFALACAAGCGSTAVEGVDASPLDASAVEDAALGDAGPIQVDDASTPPGADGGPGEDGSLPDVDAGPPAAADAGPGPLDAGGGVDPRFLVDMTFATANIGRDYDGRAPMVAAIDRVGDGVSVHGRPRFIGWQEIGEGDPCGDCEIEAIDARFTDPWDTRRPRGARPSGGTELVKVPVTGRGAADGITARAAFASPGWAGVSPTRFVTVVHYPRRNLSVVNTHLIAGAWSCRSNVGMRREYWRQAWSVLQGEVAAEHDRGRNVIVTGDLNRARSSNGCNPAWEPTSLHPSSRIIGGAGIDYIFAVPAEGWSFQLARDADGAVQRDSIGIGIDSHRAHWVGGRFRAQ